MKSQPFFVIDGNGRARGYLNFYHQNITHQAISACTFVRFHFQLAIGLLSQIMAWSHVHFFRGCGKTGICCKYGAKQEANLNKKKMQEMQENRRSAGHLQAASLSVQLTTSIFVRRTIVITPTIVKLMEVFSFTCQSLFYALCLHLTNLIRFPTSVAKTEYCDS